MSLLDAGTGPASPLHALTGLRFFAALAVITVHSRLLATGLESDIDPVAANAVSFFFVLSGFILTYVYCQKLTWRGIPGFYLARFARIWPLHAVCLVAAVAILFAQKRIGFSTPDLWFRLATHGVLVQSWLPRPGWADWFNGPAWSISTELGFYLLFPFLVLLRRGWFWLALLAVALATAGGLWRLEIHAAGSFPQQVFGQYLGYVHPLFRLLEFAVGMAVGRVFRVAARGGGAVAARPFRDTLLELLALGLLVTAVRFCSTDTGWIRAMVENGWKVVPVWASRGGLALLASAFVVWVFAWSGGMVARFLSRPLLVWLGEISFALYLVQQPVMNCLGPLVLDRDISVPVLMGTVLAISLAFAAVLYTGVETPLRRAIVSGLGGRGSEGLRILASIPKQLWDSGVLVGAVLVIAAASGILSMELRNSGDQQKRIASAWGSLAAGRAFDRVTFQNEAVLHGADVRVVDGDVRLTLLWEVLPGNSKSRFIHFTEPGGAIVKQGPEQRKLFADAAPGSMVLDEVTFRKGTFPPGSILGIGFYEKDRGTARINRGVLGMNNRRLELARLTAQGPRRIRDVADLQ